MSDCTKKPTKTSKGIPFSGWCLALICLIVCVFLTVSQIQTVIMLQQQGVVTQSTIVALAPCSIPNRQPDASASQQGVLLTISFTDARSGKIDTETFPGCQQGAYHLGDHFPVRYLPADPTTIVQASSDSVVPGGALLALGSLSIGMLLSSAIVAVGAFDFIEQWRYRRLFAELRRHELPRKKVQ